MSRVRVDDISSTITFAQYQLNRSCNGYKPIALAILQAKTTFVGNYILPLLNARDTQDLTKGRNRAVGRYLGLVRQGADLKPEICRGVLLKKMWTSLQFRSMQLKSIHDVCIAHIHEGIQQTIHTQIKFESAFLTTCP